MPEPKSDLKELANRDATVSKYRYTVLYADTGKRKTTTAVRMVKDNGIILSTDSSWKVLDNPRHKDIRGKIGKIVNLEGLSQLQHIDFSGFDTVIWDTVSRSVDRYLDLLYDEASWGGKYREPISSRNDDLKGVQILAPMDYRVTRDIFRPAFRKLFDLPAHIIFTSQHKEPIKGLSADTAIRPDIPAATFKILADQADIIANIRPESRNFIADTTINSLAYLGKSRIEGIEGKMDLDSFVAKYKEIAFQ